MTKSLSQWEKKCKTFKLVKEKPNLEVVKSYFCHFNLFNLKCTKEKVNMKDGKASYK